MLLVADLVGGGVEILPVFPGGVAISWTAEGAPGIATIADSTGAGQTWKLGASGHWGWGTSFTVPAGTGAPSVPNGKMRTWTLPDAIRAEFVAPSWEARSIPTLELTEGGPAAGWLAGENVAAHAGPTPSKPLVGPVAVRLANGEWAEPDVLRGISPVTWQAAGDQLLVRFHGERTLGPGHLMDPDAPQGTWVIERARGGVVYANSRALTPWPGGAARVPPPEPECPGETRKQVLPPGVFTPPLRHGPEHTDPRNAGRGVDPARGGHEDFVERSLVRLDVRRGSRDLLPLRHGGGQLRVGEAGGVVARHTGGAHLGARPRAALRLARGGPGRARGALTPRAIVGPRPRKTISFCARSAPALCAAIRRPRRGERSAPASQRQ